MPGGPCRAIKSTNSSDLYHFSALRTCRNDYQTWICACAALSATPGILDGHHGLYGVSRRCSFSRIVTQYKRQSSVERPRYGGPSSSVYRAPVLPQYSAVTFVGLWKIQALYPYSCICSGWRVSVIRLALAFKMRNIFETGPANP